MSERVKGIEKLFDGSGDDVYISVQRPSDGGISFAINKSIEQRTFPDLRHADEWLMSSLNDESLKVQLSAIGYVSAGGYGAIALLYGANAGDTVFIGVGTGLLSLAFLSARSLVSAVKREKNLKLMRSTLRDEESRVWQAENRL